MMIGFSPFPCVVSENSILNANIDSIFKKIFLYQKMKTPFEYVVSEYEYLQISCISEQKCVKK